MFRRPVWRSHTQWCAGSIRLAALLQNMNQFVGQQSASLRSGWRILPCSEDYVLPNGVCQRTYCPRRFRRPCVVVYANPTEVMPQAVFEELPCGSVQRLASRLQRFTYNGWRFLQTVTAFGYPALDDAARLPPGLVRKGRQHDIRSDAIGFLFKDIPGLVHVQLRLEYAGIHVGCLGWYMLAWVSS